MKRIFKVGKKKIGRKNYVDTWEKKPPLSKDTGRVRNMYRMSWMLVMPCCVRTMTVRYRLYNKL